MASICETIDEILTNGVVLVDNSVMKLVTKSGIGSCIIRKDIGNVSLDTYTE